MKTDWNTLFFFLDDNKSLSFCAADSLPAAVNAHIKSCRARSVKSTKFCGRLSIDPGTELIWDTSNSDVPITEDEEMSNPVIISCALRYALEEYGDTMTPNERGALRRVSAKIIKNM